jgi:hypothetical protein
VPTDSTGRLVPPKYHKRYAYDSARPTYLVALRLAHRSTHERLRAAAHADNVTLGAELDRLLDLRERWDGLTSSAHPLGQPAEIEPVRCLVCAMREDQARDERVRAENPDGLRDGVDYFVGRGYWTPPTSESCTP